MPFFKAFDANGNSCIIEEHNNDFGLVKIPGKLGMWSYRIDTSTYIAENGVVYSSMDDKIRKYNNSENINYALHMLRCAGYIR